VTRPGIDPGTVRLVAQRLNHYATPGPIHNSQVKVKVKVKVKFARGVLFGTSAIRLFVPFPRRSSFIHL
jgi:hypothetical protein